MQPLYSPLDVQALGRASQAYAVIAAWSEAGLFAALEEGPLSAEEIPADTRAVRITAAILAHMGLLHTDGPRWGLTRSGRRLLEAGALGLGGAARALGDLSRLDAVLSKGGPARGPDGESRVTEGGVREHDPEGARVFMDMLYRRSRGLAQDVAEAILARAGAGVHVLDLGGGHGGYGKALVDRGATVTLFDRPMILEIARERFGDELGYRAGDFLSDDDLGGPYDAALLSNIVHGLGEGENTDLFRRLAASLRPGGLLVIKDMLLDDFGAHPEEAAFFGLSMLMYTREGSSYSVGDMARLAGAAGFAPPDVALHADERYSLLFAQRS